MAELSHIVRSSLFRPTLAAVGVSVLALLTPASPIGSRSYAAADANIAASERSMASQLFHTDAIGATVSEADTTARRFVLTRRTAERKAFDEGKQRYPDQLVRLRGQFAGQTEAVPHLLTLAESVATHFTVLEEVIERAHRDDALTGLMLIESDFSQREREKVFNAIRALETMELAQLEQRSNSAAKRAESVQALNAGLIVFVVTLAGTGAWLLFRRVREIEGLITVCAWTRQVRWKGHWMSFEDYLAKRFHLQCTHGICEEAANKLLFEAENPDSAPPFPTTYATPGNVGPFPNSASPFPSSASPFPRPFASDSAAPFPRKSYGAAPGAPPPPV